MKNLVLTFCIFFIQTIVVNAADKVTPLVDTKWLQQNLTAKDQVILDVRPAKNYAQGHVPGAVSAPYNVGWRKTVDGVIGMLPPEEEITAHIRSLGIDNHEHVVLLPHGNSSTDFGAATRIYWTFKVLGHDKVSILDGGHKAWKVQAGTLSNAVVSVTKGDFEPNLRPELIASEKQVQVALGQNIDFVDARPLGQFQGKSKSPVVKRAGTIPNSKNLIQSKLYDGNVGSFADASKLNKLTDAANLENKRQTIAFCNTGHWASLAWFALSEIQGRANISLYDGSMTEWARNDANRVHKAQ